VGGGEDVGSFIGDEEKKEHENHRSDRTCLRNKHAVPGSQLQDDRKPTPSEDPLGEHLGARRPQRRPLHVVGVRKKVEEDPSRENGRSH